MWINFRNLLRWLACLAVALSQPSLVAAQNVNNMINLFGGLMRAAIIEGAKTEWRKVRPVELACIETQLQQQGTSIEVLVQQGIFPNDGRVTNFRVVCAKAAAVIPAQVTVDPINQPSIPAVPPALSARPTFDCTVVKSALGSILCADKAGAMADWEIDTAFHALKYSVPETARDAVSRSHDDWIQAVDRTCRLPARQPVYSPQQRQCVLNAYRVKANAYRSRLRGDALAEIRLSPEERAQLQIRLIDLGLLDGPVDGQFGPMTRDAIRRYQGQVGDPQTEFLSSAQRIRLAARPLSPPNAQTQPAPPTADTIDVQTSQLTVAEAEQQCQSEDTNRRLAACTAIINAKGKGFNVTVVDAYDGRCRSYNDQQLYRRAVEDCNAAIARNPRHKYAYNNLAVALIGLGDTQKGLAAYSTSIELNPNWIYSYLGRGRAYWDIEEREKAKNDFDKVLSIDSNNEQAKVALASLQVDSPILRDVRLFLQDAKQFVSELNQAPASISQIATAAADLEIAIKGFNDASAFRARAHLADLLIQLDRFEDFLRERREDRDRVVRERFARASADGTSKLLCINDYIKRDIASPKNAALDRLRLQLDAAIKRQDLTEIEKTSGAVTDYFEANGILCQASPVSPGPAPADATFIRMVRVYLDDLQAFLRTQPNIDQNKIADIALASMRLQGAINSLAESEARQFKARLDDLLEPVAGFADFVTDRELARRREVDRQFAIESVKAEKGLYFIGEFLRRNLTYSKTETLLKHRTQLENSRRPPSISDESLNELKKAAEDLEAFVRENSLSSDYDNISSSFDQPRPSRPVPEPGLPITDKTKVALVGPDRDMVFLFNSAASAPSIAKDLAGRFVFLTGSASVCFAQSDSMDEERRWFLERTLRQEGAREVKGDDSRCDFAKIPRAFDIVVFQRGELLKQRRDYVIGLTDLLQKDDLREYRVVSAADYDAAVQGIRATALRISSEVESNTRTGFGVIIVTDSGTPACAIVSNHIEELGLALLLQRDKELISRRLRFDWNVINVTVENGFVALTRQQCGYAAGDARALRMLMLALRRDDKKYEFAPIWFPTDDVVAAGTEEIRRRDAAEKAIAAQNNMDTAALEQREAQKQAIEERLRSENGPRARALKDGVDSVVRADAFMPLTDMPRVASATQRLFPGFASWLNRQFDGQWETTEVASEIADYGKVQWNGRTLDGIIVQINVTQKNRIQGIYATTCFTFGQVVDDEFAMRRDMFSVPCSGSRPMLDDWRTRRELRSLWNAPEVAAIGTSP
jgi:Putative peptidoglycan binding domain/Tetratricopeptide repeat